MNNETRLQAAIRAARLGQRQAATNILQAILNQDPDNEEALLWLARVAPTAEVKQYALDHALTLNPNNLWATEQLRTLSAGGAVDAPTPIISPADGPTLESLACPNCGGAVELQGGQGIQTVACRFCGSVLDLTADQAAIVGQANQEIQASIPLKLGMTGRFNNINYLIIGWIRYQGHGGGESWEWDEFLMVSPEGQFRWLSYSPDEGFVFQEKTYPTKPFDPHTAKLISVPGGMATVTERNTAKIIALAGELTWQGRVGNTIRYLEAKRGKKYRYSVEYTHQEIELMAGEVIRKTVVAKAFNLSDLNAVAIDRGEKDEGEAGGRGCITNAFEVMVFLFIGSFIMGMICLVVMAPDSDGVRYSSTSVCPAGVVEVTAAPNQPAPTPCPTATPRVGSSVVGGGFSSFGGGSSSGFSSGGFSSGK